MPRARARRTSVVFGFFVALVVAVPLASINAAPSATTTTVQLRITTPAGQPASGALSLVFRIFPTASGGTALWTEVHDGTALPKVTAVNGIISAVLGEGTPLDPSILDPSAHRWLGVELAGQEVARVKLTASSYAVAASAASGLWDPLTSSVLDLVALDGRYVRATGGGGVVRTITGVSPDAAGNFALSAGPSGRVTFTPTASGLQVETAQPVESLNGARGAVSIAAGANVTVTTDGGTITVNAQAGGLTQAEADARYVNASGGTESVSGDFFVGGGLTAQGDLIVNATNNSGGISRINSTELWLSRLVRMGQFDPSPGSILYTNGQFHFSHEILAPSKAFVVPHPADATKEIVYYSLEGPESGLYARGCATLANGTVTIALPEHFALLAIATSITVQVTPTTDCKGLFVQSKSPTEVVVRELGAGTSNATFDYMVIAQRIGTENKPVIRNKVQ